MAILSPTSIGSGEAFGALSVAGPLSPESIGSDEGVGNASITGPGLPRLILPYEVSTESFFPDPAVIGSQLILPDGILPTEDFGTLATGRIIQMVGIDSAEAFGDPKSYKLITGAGGIATAPAVGRPSVSSVLLVVGTSWPKTQHWSLYLAYSTLIRPGTPDRPPTIAELVQAKGVSVEMVLNRPGACHFTISLDDDRTQYIVPVHTCILAVRDGIVRWSGPVWTVDHDISGGNASVSAVGWLDLLDHRKIRINLNAPTQNDNQRVAALFDAMNSQVNYTDGARLDAPMTYIGHNGATQSRPQKVYERGNPIGSCINELVEVENGFDITVNPTTREMTTHRSELKPGWGLYGHGTDKPDALFAYGVGSDNLSTITQQVDASTLANVVNAVGGGGIIYATDDPRSILENGVFEDDFPMTDAGVSEDMLKLGANMEVALRSTPRITWQATPFPWTVDGNVPRLFDDYDVGDIVRLAVKRSWLNIPEELEESAIQPVRVFGATVTLDDNGDERITSLELVSAGDPFKATIPPPPPPPPPTILPSLTYWYRFNEIAPWPTGPPGSAGLVVPNFMGDTSTYGRNATAFNYADGNIVLPTGDSNLPETGIPGPVPGGRGIQFNWYESTSHYFAVFLQCPTGATIEDYVGANAPVGSASTFAAWLAFVPSETVASGIWSLISTWSRMFGVSNYGVRIGFDQVTGALDYHVGNSNNSQEFDYQTPPCVPYEWFHFAAQIVKFSEGLYTRRFFLNGALVFEDNGDATAMVPSSAQAALSFGGGNSNDIWSVHGGGRIAEVAHWTQELSQPEIAELWLQGAG